MQKDLSYDANAVKTAQKRHISGRYEQAEENLARQSDALLSCEDSVICSLYALVTKVTTGVSESRFLNQHPTQQTNVLK